MTAPTTRVRRPRPIAVAISALLLAPMATAEPVSAQSAPLAFTRVHVVPMDREQVLENQTVIVQDGRIVQVGPSAAVRPPADATVIDAAGKFLMPGLAEMHAHVPPGTQPAAVVDRVLSLYVANGITTMRSMLGERGHLALREQLARGELLGPRLIASGPSFNGTTTRTPAMAIDSVVAQKQLGYDFLKIHPGVSRAAFDSMAAAAQRVGIRFAGHVPLDVGYRRALEARYATIDHLDGLLEALRRDDAPLTTAQGGFFGLALVDWLDTTRLPALAAATRDAGVYMVPTAALLDAWVDDTPADSLAARPEMRYWLPNQVRSWVVNKQNLLTAGTYTPAQRARFVHVRRQMMAALRAARVRFLLGSDSPQVWNVPGFSIHRELSALVAAGFTPYEALQTGTVNVAEFLGESATSGTVQVGRRADLVLLDGNPLRDIHNASRIAGVMVNGRWLSRADLDEKLAALRN